MDPSEIENLQYKKTADSVLLSMFTLPSTGLRGILLSVRTQYF